MKRNVKVIFLLIEACLLVSLPKLNVYATSMERLVGTSVEQEKKTNYDELVDFIKYHGEWEQKWDKNGPYQTYTYTYYPDMSHKIVLNYSENASGVLFQYSDIPEQYRASMTYSETNLNVAGVGVWISNRGKTIYGIYIDDFIMEQYSKDSIYEKLTHLTALEGTYYDASAIRYLHEAIGGWQKCLRINTNLSLQSLGFADFEEPVDTPTITRLDDKLIIKTTTPDSIIYYTTDGSVPTIANGVKVNGSSTTIDTFSGHVKAIAVKDGYANSDMAKLTLFTANKERNVSFGVKGIFGGRNVTFNSNLKGAKIYYSSTTSTLTTKDKCVNVGDTVLFENFYGTIYARTYKDGQWGNVCRLILKIPVVKMPTISIDNKGYATIKTVTPNSYLYYTTDGSIPSTTNGRKIGSSCGRVYVGTGKTVKAIAVRSCFTNSDVLTKK